jgi:hypothetical protein
VRRPAPPSLLLRANPSVSTTPKLTLASDEL